VPVQNGKGWDCYGIGGGGGGGTPAEVEDPNPDEAGGSVIPPNFFTPTYPTPPSLWNPFPINNPPNGAPSSGSSLGNVSEKQKKDYLIQQLNLSPSQIEYIYQNTDLALSLFNYLSFDNSPTKKEIAIWAIEYFQINPLTQLKEFENWFLNQPEYLGGESFINPDLITYDQIVQQVTLPSLSRFETNFPKIGFNGNYTEMKAPSVYELVGSTLFTNHLSGNPSYQNACAIRGSRALLYSGITIPVLRYGGTQRTEKGNDNYNYILDAVSFNKFMIDKFGETSYKLTDIDANDANKVINLLKGKNGIYVILNNDGSINGAGYSGHVDFILNGQCISGAFTRPTGGVKSIRIWVLK
jgi:hypothetical protein